MSKENAKQDKPAYKNILYKIFKLEENNTRIHTEIVAGLTTFMTMAYIIALNPNLLTGFAVGTPLWNGVFLATCIASGIGTMCMAFLANKPFVMAPGMGLNSFFATVAANIVVLNGYEGDSAYTNAFQAALWIIIVEGIVFLILSFLNVREKIVDAIPIGIRLGIGPAIGLMLMNIGFGSNAQVYDESGNAYYTMRDFFGAMMPKMLRDSMEGDVTGHAAFRQLALYAGTMLIGVCVIALLAKRGVKAAVILGMLDASILYWIGEAVILDTNPFESLKTASFVPPFKDMVDTTLFKFDFKGFFDIGIFTAVTLIITFCMIDMFDTIGTLVGTASRAGMVDENGNMPQMKQALISDATGTLVGACTGTSTVTTFVESASGVESGGRTGLTAFTAAVMFLLCIFFAPVAAIIPAPATSAALIYVGIIMLQGLKKINMDDMDQVVPVFIMLLAMPISRSIGHGIGLAMISYTFLKIFFGETKDVSLLTLFISALFTVKFFVVA